MLVSELITRSLKLINVPGRGATLSADDQTDALETLEELLASESVSKFFQPGIRRHFFSLTAGKAIYTYGPGAELDTDDFDDPVPIHIESALIRRGATITDNEEVTSYRFKSTTGWTVGTGWAIANDLATATAAATLSQTLALTSGTTYEVRATAIQRAGDVVLKVLQDGTEILDETLDSSGDYLFEITFAGTTSEVEFITDAATDDLDISEISILPKGTARKSLPDGTGTDTALRAIDQRRYQRLASKGAAGAPSAYLFSRAYPFAELRFDGAASSGDVLIADVRVERTVIDDVDDTVPLNGAALEYVRYALADRMAGLYGKSLTPGQMRLMQAAYDRLVAGNLRFNTLRVDRGLRHGRPFSFDAGD